MEFIVDAPVHPLATGPTLRPYSSPSPLPISSQTSSSQLASGFQPQQHRKMVILKSEHGYFPTSPPPSQRSFSMPDIVMTDESSNVVLVRTEELASSPAMEEGMKDNRSDDDNNSSDDNGQQERSSSPLVDTDAIIPTPSQPSHSTIASASPMTASTPTTASLTLDGGTTTPSSRRPSLRTMTATLPRSPLQEETIALFKQYRALIPCAKCFSRNTIQRDGMSGKAPTRSPYPFGCSTMDTTY